MSSEWLNRTLGDVAFISSGKRPPVVNKERVPNANILVIGGGGPSGYTEQSLTTEPVLITGRVGTLGKLHVSHEPVWPSDNALVIRPRREVVSFDYLRYALGGVIHLAIGMNRGAANPLVTQSDLSKLPIPVPDAGVQAEIAAVLKSLDDRITLLRGTNATLEAIAQALFKSWFVDFDPVRAKMEGRTPEGMDEDTAALFPDSFEESELGLVPRGWPIGRLDDLLVLQRGFDLPAQDRTPGAYPIIAASGPSGTHREAMVKGPGVVTGRSGVLGRVFLEFGDYWPLNTTLWVKEYRAATPCFAYELLRLLDFKSFNAGSAVPTLNRNHIHGLSYVIPVRGCVVAFEAIGRPLHERVKTNEMRIETLSMLRDTLLPRLISGQLRLPEAEVAIKEAAPA